MLLYAAPSCQDNRSKTIWSLILIFVTQSELYLEFIGFFFSQQDFQKQPYLHYYEYDLNQMKSKYKGVFTSVLPSLQQLLFLCVHYRFSEICPSGPSVIPHDNTRMCCVGSSGQYGNIAAYRKKSERKLKKERKLQHNVWSWVIFLA